MITKEQVLKITGTNKYVTDDLVKGLNDTLTKYSINTKLRMCHFLAQILHESGSFSTTSENLNYSADGLVKIFGKYFNTTTATAYARQPEKIANKVYASRMGNGDEKSGDGWKFKGRGYIQNTGHDTYLATGKELGIDLITHPELLSTNPYAMLSAGYYWNSRNINKYADLDDILNVTKKVNGGTLGLDDRTMWLKKCKEVL
jgi:putative chitinase